jgi:hypothetical protein
MALDSSSVLIRYLETEFPGARVRESTHEAEEWPLMRCFRVNDGRTPHLLIVASRLFATRSDVQMRDFLEDHGVAGYLFRARGSPVLLTEGGLSLVE